MPTPSDSHSTAPKFSPTFKKFKISGNLRTCAGCLTFSGEMATEIYLPPQKRAQSVDITNNEGKLAGPILPTHAKKNQDRSEEKSKAKGDWLLRDTTQEITSFDAARLGTGSVAVDSNTDAELLCSYNWISSKRSAIYVPGAPPAWTPKVLPSTLPMDYGLYCPQQAAYRTPEYPYEPLYQALGIMNPESDFKATDLVTNRKCLQMLFQFVSGISFQDFRIDLHLVFDTLFLTRRTPKTFIIAYAHGTTKVGSNFESAFTTLEPGLEDSSSHHRVVCYALGDLKCVVRYEADACYEKDTKDLDVIDQRCANFFSSLSEENFRAKCKQLFSSTEPKAVAGPAADTSPHTSVIFGGRIVPSSSIVELKTFQGKNFCVKYHLPQLWFGRTSNLFVGTHNDGTFHKLEALDVGNQLREWETEHQVELRKLACFIAQLRELARGRPGKCCVLVGKGKARRATVYDAAKQTCVLPDYTVKQFWR